MKRYLSCIVILGSLLFAPVLALGDTASVAIEKADVQGIKNFSRMDGPQAFAGSPVGFGGGTEPSAMAFLSEAGFASVISLRGAEEEGMDVAASRQAAEAAGMRYLHLPFDPQNLRPGEIERVLDAAADPTNHPVYIHCNSATRVGAVWMIGRVLRDGRKIDSVRAEVEQIAKNPTEAIDFATAYLGAHKDVPQ